MYDYYVLGFAILLQVHVRVWILRCCCEFCVCALIFVIVLWVLKLWLVICFSVSRCFEFCDVVSSLCL